MDESQRFIELAILEELRNTIRCKQITKQLVEQLALSLHWLLHYSIKYGIPLPEKEKIIDLINMAIEIEQKLPSSSLPTKLKQPDKTTNNETESIIWLC